MDDTKKRLRPNEKLRDSVSDFGLLRLLSFFLMIGWMDEWMDE